YAGFLQQGFQPFKEDVVLMQQYKYRRFKPCADLKQSIRRWRWRLVYSGVRDYGVELKYARPGDCPCRSAFREFCNSSARFFVPGGIRAVGIDQDVRIDGGHFNRYDRSRKVAQSPSWMED